MMCLFTATTAVALVVGLALYSLGLLPIHPFWWQRPAMALASEDYAAYSGFVNDFFSSRQPFRVDQSISPDNTVYIAAETLTMKNTAEPILPLEVAALGPEDMGQDFFRQNAKSWLLEARFRTDLKFDVVGDAGKWLPHANPAGPFPENPKVSGVLQLSRIGLDHTQTHGMVYYVYRCGVLCGQSGWATLRKVHGEWKLDQMGGGLVY